MPAIIQTIFITIINISYDAKIIKNPRMLQAFEEISNNHTKLRSNNL